MILRASAALTASTLFAVGEPVELHAAAEEGGVPTFKGVAYTGGKMRPMGFYRDVYVDLAGAKVAGGQRPVHRDHMASKIVGHTDSITIDGKKILCSGVISGTGPDAAEVRGNAKNKFPWRLSIGASIEKMDFIDEGESFECNGRSFKAPKGACYVVRACTIYEVSFVSLAGDDNTSATVSAQQGVLIMKFGQWLAARGQSIDDLTATQLAELRAEFDAETNPEKKTNPAPKPTGKKPAQDPPRRVKASRDPESDDDAPVRIDLTASRKELAAELERTETIVALCAKYGEPKIKVGDEEVSLRVHATREGWDVNKVELEALRASRPTNGPGIQMVDRTATASVIEASLLMASGMTEDDIKDDFDDKTMNAAMSKQHRGMGLQQLICAFILANGGHATPGRFNDDTIRSAFELQRNLSASGTGGTSYSLPGILSNVANKAMRTAYRAVPDVLSKVARYGSTNDFKAQSTYQLTTTGEFKLVGPDGELKQGSMVETGYTNKAETRGQTLSLTRQHMRNDDLGAFLRIPTALARKGATSLQKIGFALLESSAAATFFAVGNKNYMEGAGTALDIDQLTLLCTMFEEQVDENGDPIGVTPTILLTASKNKVLGRQLYDETKIQSGNTGKVLASNPHAGLFQPESTPFLTVNKDAWYLFADPSDIAALEVIFLDGRQTPIVEAGELDFTHLGMAYRGYFDFGCAFGDHRGAAKSKGKA